MRQGWRPTASAIAWPCGATTATYSADITDTVKAQHLMYAVWGATWHRDVLDVAATWDGGPGVGAQAKLVQVSAPGVGESVDVAFAPTPPGDPRIAGYRIYRADELGDAVPIGSTLVEGFLDVAALLDHVYQYTVTSYTADGVESGPSNVMQVTPSSYQVYLPLIRR